MLKRYKAPDGTCWLYDEGEQPDDFELADAPAQDKADEPKAKARAPRNKARTAKAK